MFLLREENMVEAVDTPILVKTEFVAADQWCAAIRYRLLKY